MFALIERVTTYLDSVTGIKGTAGVSLLPPSTLSQAASTLCASLYDAFLVVLTRSPFSTPSIS